MESCLFPGGHCVHKARPLFGSYVPTGHDSHAVWPANGCCVPAEQLLQGRYQASRNGWTVPGRHGVQMPVDKSA
jgi:hypothetical protein